MTINPKATCLVIGLLCSPVFSTTGLATAPNPKERIGFWQENYTVLSPESEPRIGHTQQIFRQLLNAAGHRRGIEPRLLIIKEDPHNLSLPISIPDGWIIVSRAVLELCYQDAQRGDARLAFVLAHELAHQLEDDFWHMKFFQALDADQARSPSAKKLYSEIQAIARQSDKILAKELRADELGIIYTTMAGFDSQAIIEDQNHGNFFQLWSRARHPVRYTELDTTPTHPSIRQRTTAVKARLRQVTEQSDLFKLGLWFFHSGDYEQAIASFDEFRRYFPGRAVHLNLATSYHRLAMRYYHTHKTAAQQLQFQLSMLVDPESRAGQATLRGTKPTDNRFTEYMQQAVHYYQLAIEQDPTYLYAYHNLSSAWLHLNQPYKAIALLQDGLLLKPNDPGLLNNLGVAFYETGNPDKARQYLQQARQQQVDYALPLFNLGNIAWREGIREQAQDYWQQYLALQPERLWAAYLLQRSKLELKYQPVKAPRNSREDIDKLQVGHYMNEISGEWKIAMQQQYKLHNSTHHLIRYANHVTTLTEGDEIRMIATDAQFRGKTRQGIAIGAEMQEVIKHYGSPDYIDYTAQGRVLAYPTQGISFQLTQNRVASWLLYWE